MALFMAVVVPGVLYLATWPVPVEPEAWNPPRRPALRGPFEANRVLRGADSLDVGGEGPEDVAIGPDGRIYTGLRDGRIVSLDPDGRGLENFARTGGRPLGLRFDRDGRLLVADTQRGLLAVSPEGDVSVLASGHGGAPFRLTDDLDVGADGTVYFSDASARFGMDESIVDVIEHRPTGRLLAYDPRRGTTRVLLDGLCFANGVALAPDESFVLVVETSCYRVRRLWLRGERAGRSDEFIGGLPAFPDGITGDGQGTYWLALVSPRDALLDALHPHPALKKVLLRLPAVIRGGPAPYGFVLGLDGEGNVIANLQDPGGATVAYVTNAVPHGQWLYMGRLVGDFVSRFSRSTALAP